MTRMLASVLDAAEAGIALEAGADIIDLKDARNGALGALPLETVAQALEAVGGRRPVSATLGDLPMQPELLCRQAAALGATGVDFIKVGLFEAPGRAACVEALAAIAARHRLVGVLFAEQRPDLRLMPLLARSGFGGVMVDTAQKSVPGIRHQLGEAALREFLAAARDHGLICGLAGSLALEDIAPLVELGPDYLGFRGALCAAGRRGGPIDAAAVAKVRQAIARQTAQPALTRPPFPA